MFDKSKPLVIVRDSPDGNGVENLEIDPIVDLFEETYYGMDTYMDGEHIFIPWSAIVEVRQK